MQKITPTKARLFLEDYHLQGHAQASEYLGLEDNEGRLISVMALKSESKHNDRSLQILRYATIYNNSSFSNFISHIEKNSSIAELVGFSDNCFSMDALYKDQGFYMDIELPPDYMYLLGKIRVPRTKYPLKRFRENRDLEWVEGVSRRELEKMNKLNRIWDAGKIRWIKLLGKEV